MDRLETDLTGYAQEICLRDRSLVGSGVRRGELRGTADHGVELAPCEVPFRAIGHVAPLGAHSASMITAPPCPPPMHADPRANVPPRRRSS